MNFWYHVLIAVLAAGLFSFLQDWFRWQEIDKASKLAQENQSKNQDPAGLDIKTPS